MVTMGGGAINNQTPKVLKALKDIAEEVDELTVYIVSGVGCQDKRQQCLLVSEKNLEVKVMHDPDNLVQLMAETDIAISGGGSTCYELACLGIPSIIISLADNQKGVAKKIGDEGIAAYLGHYEDVSAEDIKRAARELMDDYEGRKGMSDKGKKMIDGRGVKRVVQEIKNLMN
jgi:spore coat polysaccharide biosynthesis predicted glycosyltransferase SpsG